MTEANEISFHVKHAVGSAGYEALLIGGRSGVGKSTVAWEASAQLQECSVAHCFIEGDFLDQAFPPQTATRPVGTSPRTTSTRSGAISPPVDTGG